MEDMKITHRAFYLLIIVQLTAGLLFAQGARYAVQIEASPTREDAVENVNQLKAKNVQAYIVKTFIPGKGTFYRVRVGAFLTQSEAKRFGDDIQRRGIISEYFIAAYERPTEDIAAVAPPKPIPAPVQKEQPVKPQTSPAAETRKESQITANVAPAAPNKPSPPPAGNPADKAEPKAVVGGVPPATTTADPAPAYGLIKYQDPNAGFSLEYPNYWKGQPLSQKEASDQRMNAGAQFQSNEDAAFLNAIWNDLDKANNPANDNDLIVEVILKSMASGEGTQLQETSRRVETVNGTIKTYLELKAAFQSQGQRAPLDFFGKAVIIRAAKGILLVVTFYSKDAPPNSANIAEKIIASVRAPE
jgi:outer membrane biosynthesis protein TonB